MAAAAAVVAGVVAGVVVLPYQANHLQVNQQQAIKRQLEAATQEHPYLLQASPSHLLPLPLATRQEHLQNQASP